MILWETCQSDFEPDGALRDIYVHDTTIADWRAVFDALRDKFTLQFCVDGESRPFPREVDEVFTLRETANPSLAFDIGGIQVACHFFIESEIEFDLWPREVDTQEQLDKLLQFICLIGDTVQKSVSLCVESCSQYPIITYDPRMGELTYCEPPKFE